MASILPVSLSLVSFQFGSIAAVVDNHCSSKPINNGSPQGSPITHSFYCSSMISLILLNALCIPKLMILACTFPHYCQENPIFRLNESGSNALISDWGRATLCCSMPKKPSSSTYPLDTTLQKISHLQ